MSPYKRSQINVSTLPLPNDLLIAPAYSTSATKKSGGRNENGESSSQGVPILQSTLQQQQQCKIKDKDLNYFNDETPSNDSTSGSSSSTTETVSDASLEITLPQITLGDNVSRTSTQQRQRQHQYMNDGLNDDSHHIISPNKSLVSEGTRLVDVSCHNLTQPHNTHQESSSISTNISKRFHPSSVVSSLSGSVVRTFSSFGTTYDDSDDDNNVFDEEQLDEAVEVFITASPSLHSPDDRSYTGGHISSPSTSTELHTVVSCKSSTKSNSTISSHDSQLIFNHQSSKVINRTNTHSEKKGISHCQQNNEIIPRKNISDDFQNNLSFMSVSGDQEDTVDTGFAQNYLVRDFSTTQSNKDYTTDKNKKSTNRELNNSNNVKQDNNHNNSLLNTKATAKKSLPPSKRNEKVVPSDNDELSSSNHRRLDLDLTREHPPSTKSWESSDFDGTTSVSSYQPGKSDKLFNQRLTTNYQKSKLPYNPAKINNNTTNKSIHKNQTSSNNEPKQKNSAPFTFPKPPNEKQTSGKDNIAYSTTTHQNIKNTLQGQTRYDRPRKSVSISNSFQSSSLHSSSSSYTSYTNTHFTPHTYDSGRQSSFYTDDETKTYDYTETTGFDNSTWASGTIDRTVENTTSNMSKSGVSIENDDNITLIKDQQSYNSKISNSSLLLNLTEKDDDDQIHLSVAPLTTIPYVHCGYAATAPIFLNDKKWMEILKNLMPESFADALSLIKYSKSKEAERVRRGIKSASPALDPAKIMKWAENNPIVAAYGILNSDAGRKVYKETKRVTDNENFKIDDGEASHFATVRKLRRMGFKSGFNDMKPPHSFDNNNNYSVRSSSPTLESSSTTTKNVKQLKPPIEWDVFLDPVLVAQVDKSMEHVNELRRKSSLGDNNSICDETLVVADIEVDRQVGRLINRMMLAHGSTPQLVAEALGMAPRYTFSRVVEQGESIRRAQQTKNTPLRKKLISVCNMLDVDDAAVDDLYIVESNRTTRQVQFAEDQVIKEGRKATRASATGIFVERWLALFASALEMARSDGITSNNSTVGSSFVGTGGPNHKSSLRKTTSFRRSTSSFLRHNSFSSLDPEDNHFADVNSFVHHSAKNHDVSVPQAACGLFLCLGMEDPNSRTADHGNTTMAESAKLIKKLLDGQQLKVVLDLKSRRVPPRVWARLIDNLKSRGLSVEGIGSFDLDELRSISSLTCTPTTGINFFHSAGDLQRACHAKEIRHGDTVYFNAGSLLYKKPSLWEATNFALCVGEVDNVNMAYVSQKRVDDSDLLGSCDINFQPYAYSRKELRQRKDLGACKATIEDYQKFFNLNIGLYVQEFSISKEHLNALTIFVNDHPSIYNLGLAWGGLNGVAIKGMKGDGFWSQRYVGRNWDFAAKPTNNMSLLAPEDHHLIQKAILAGPCGQVYTGNQVDEREHMESLGVRGICD